MRQQEHLLPTAWLKDHLGLDLVPTALLSRRLAGVAREQRRHALLEIPRSLASGCKDTYVLE